MGVHRDDHARDSDDHDSCLCDDHDHFDENHCSGDALDMDAE